MARSSSLALVSVVLVPVLAFVAVAQEKQDPKPEPKQGDRREHRGAGDGVAAVATPARSALPDPPAELAKLLAIYDKEPEPVRELKRLYASSLYYLLDRNLERFLLCFHKDFEVHQGSGVVKMPPADLKAAVEKQWSSNPKPAIKLEELVQLDKARAYSREQAKKWIGDWKKEPSAIAKVMADGDWLVLAPTNKKALGPKAADFYEEVFYVFRLEDGVWKIVLGE